MAEFGDIENIQNVYMAGGDAAEKEHQTGERAPTPHAQTLWDLYKGYPGTEIDRELIVLIRMEYDRGYSDYW